MQKPNQNPYLVSFSTAAFGNEADLKKFFDNTDLMPCLYVEGFPGVVVSYILDNLDMVKTEHLTALLPEDIDEYLPELTKEDKQHFLDIITWAHQNKAIIRQVFEHPELKKHPELKSMLLNTHRHQNPQ